MHGRSVHHQGAQCSDLRDRLRTNDRDLPDDQYGTDPVLHLRKSRTEYGGTELSPIPVCSRIPGIPDHDDDDSKEYEIPEDDSDDDSDEVVEDDDYSEGMDGFGDEEYVRL